MSSATPGYSATIGEAGTEGVDRDMLFAAWRSALEAGPSHAARRRLRGPAWSATACSTWPSSSCSARDAAVLMIVLARPELLDRRPAWGGEGATICIALEPLATAMPTS